MAKKKKVKGQKAKDWLPVSAGGIDKIPADGELISGVEDTPFTGPTWANDRRIADCSQARELYTRLYLENQLRQQSFAQIRNQIEGGRPFDPDALHASGEDWRTNVNFNDARAAFHRVSLPYWKMVHEVPQTISVKIHDTDPQAEAWNDIFARNFDRFLDDWGPSYFKEFSGMADDYVMYGPAHVMWEDENTPRYKWMPSIQIMLPKRTKSDIATWELICYKAELPAPELLKHIRDDKKAKDAKDAGWNPDMIRQAIKLAAPGPAQTRYFDPNYWQDMIVSNDLVIGGVWPPVAVIHLLAKSADAKHIRHYIFTEKSDVPDYIYEADEGVDEFRKLMGTVFSSFGSNGLYHAIKGFGVMNYYYATVINRTKCRMIDSATFGMGMNFVADDDTPAEVPPVENYSIINKFPKGLTQLQWYPQGLQSANELLSILTQNQNENNFTYNEPQKDIADTKTARQAVILSNIANEMSTASSAIFLSQLGGNIFAECVRRLVQKSDDKDAKKFKERCILQGVPDKLFTDLQNEKVEMTVKAGASPTMSSPAAREQIGQALMSQIYPLPDSNKRAIIEFRTASLTGADGIKQFLLPIGSASDPRARREAIMENADMAQGIVLGDPPSFGVDPSDAHVEHADEHLKPLEAICQQVQQKQPIDHGHMIALQLTLPHCQQHLNFLSQSTVEKAQYQQLKQRFMAVQSIAQGLLARLARAQQQAQMSGQPLQPQDVQSAINSGGQ
ncbi:MAG: hypothetical protein KGL39_36130 [Patescibacteria group bacterium]|nr:hypothetical protein [Patescibacteria group bacterium]